MISNYKCKHCNVKEFTFSKVYLPIFHNRMNVYLRYVSINLSINATYQRGLLHFIFNQSMVVFRLQHNTSNNKQNFHLPYCSSSHARSSVLQVNVRRQIDRQPGLCFSFQFLKSLINVCTWTGDRGRAKKICSSPPLTPSFVK